MRIFFLLSVIALASCSSSNSLRLAVPEVFKEQATMLHIDGARKRQITMGQFTSTKIKRGAQVSYPGWSRGFFLENLALNQFGVQKNETVVKEKTKFRFALSDGKTNAEVFAKENELTRSVSYKLGNGKGLFNNFEQLQDYQYVFSAMISLDTSVTGKQWELMMSNIYNRKETPKKGLFTMLKQDDNGLATNGHDTLFIKGIAVKETESPSGKKGKLLVEMLSGYEVSNSEGVVAVIDLIGKNVWFYNELGDRDRLVIASISTAIFARRVKDAAW